MKRNYIGLATSWHDGAISIVNSRGEVVFAEANERYLQSKRAFNAPADQFPYITHLIETYVEPGAELVVACTWSEKSIANFEKQLQDIKKIESEGSLPFHIKQYFVAVRHATVAQIIAIRQAAMNLELTLSQMDEYKETGISMVKNYDHHLTHAAATCFTSPFREACCVILDGFGEASAYNCYQYRNGKISRLPGIEDGIGSLGIYYDHVCGVCGFDRLLGEEWKVMGLAAYGEFDQQIHDLFKKIVKVDGLNLRESPPEELGVLFGQLGQITRKKGEPPLVAANAAYNGQLVYEKLLFEYLRNVYGENISENLALGGGCGLNSSANGKITENTGFKNLYVFSAPADDGNAVGAALLAYYEDHPGEIREPGFQPPYLGAEISEYKIDHLKRFGNIKKMKECPADIHYQAAKLLAEGKIIGWVQGKAEFGPRALGNRSILADPRSPKIKDIINDRVKFREEFRPLAPSILHEFGPGYFENYQESPYMDRALRFREDVKSKVPGVVHKDGTGRLQTVKKEWNEKFYNLIASFHELTGIPLVLNTSFNVMGKPIIHSVEDAVAVFYTSGLDALVIGNLLIEKDE